MDTHSEDYRRETLARYLLERPGLRDIFLKKHPEIADDLRDRMLQETAKRVAGYSEENRTGWFNRQHYRAKAGKWNHEKLRWIKEIERRVNEILEEQHP